MEKKKVVRGINLQIFDFKESIAKVINESGLPPTIVQMALSDIVKQVDNLAAVAINKERQEAVKEGGKEECPTSE